MSLLLQNPSSSPAQAPVSDPAPWSYDQFMLNSEEQQLQSVRNTIAQCRASGVYDDASPQGGPRSALQNYFALLRQTEQALESSIAARQASVSAQTVAEGIDPTPRTLDGLEATGGSAGNAGLQDFAKEFLRHLEALFRQGAAAGSGPAAPNSPRRDEGLGELIGLLMLALIAGRRQSTSELLGQREPSTIARLLDLLQQFTHLLRLAMLSAGGGSSGSQASGDHAAGLPDLARQLLNAFLSGSTRGVDKLPAGAGGQEVLQQILALLSRLVALLSANASGGGHAQGPAGPAAVGQGSQGNQGNQGSHGGQGPQGGVWMGRLHGMHPADAGKGPMLRLGPPPPMGPPMGDMPWPPHGMFMRIGMPPGGPDPRGWRGCRG